LSGFPSNTNKSTEHMRNIPHRMHRGAGQIAERVLGEDTPENRRVVYRWASETPPEQRPFPIRKDKRVIYVWEHDVPASDFPG
jgi:hypothetical protein